MKKLTMLLLGATLTTCGLNAQINKGTILLGGELQLSNNELESQSGKSEMKSFGFSPSIGFAFKTNSVAGLRLGYFTAKQEESSGPIAESTGFGAGVFYRKYFILGKNFYAFGEAAADYNRQKTKNVNPISTYEDLRNSYSISLQPGIAYAISRKFHLELLLNDLFSAGYSTNKRTNPSFPTNSATSKTYFVSADADVISQLTLAFRIVLGK